MLRAIFRRGTIVKSTCLVRTPPMNLMSKRGMLDALDDPIFEGDTLIGLSHPEVALCYLSCSRASEMGNRMEAS